MVSTKEQPKLLCNGCGEDQVSSETGEVYGLPLTYYRTGYYSKDLPDGKRYGFSLCERCLKILFQEFAIPPTEEDSL